MHGCTEIVHAKDKSNCNIVTWDVTSVLSYLLKWNIINLIHTYVIIRYLYIQKGKYICYLVSLKWVC